ncbi:glycoside hydrolase family 2 TIM barrel-domain containing protein [Pedobacter aquatilis]|uniref:glycoside hydrolase family 2 protein n=1 Tax=Pedobacter aquatilis TaxID=351343 RepID=UPI0025B589CF|nr:sugar-binding domain-containing protein [Pedobacter aquatilis]MDN3588470.1 glycoside hydrolase family 2 TIM barrel-domain containing protein [Pedobacter aquatilis]
MKIKYLAIYVSTGILLNGILKLNAYAQTPKLPTKWTTEAINSSNPFPDYPRPQFVRNQWLSLNGRWDYIGGKEKATALNPSLPVDFSQKKDHILVPYCPESVISGIERKQEINMWYHRTFQIPKEWNGRNVLINFEAVDHDATVFINGKKAGQHSGGYDAFSLDITSFLTPGKNEIIVAAYDSNDGRMPSGKNGPRGDYTFSSGIWQSVWLEPVAKAHIKNIRLLPDLDNSRLQVIVDGVATKVSVTALDGKRIVSQSTGMIGKSLYLSIPNPKLWSPEEPFLYDLSITATDANGETTDKVMSYFGMRDIKIGRVANLMRPLLNGKFVMQVGLLDQGYWPDGILTAPTEEALKFDLEFTKKAGFNLIRKHMKTEPKRFYYWADKMGILLWQDMPAIWYQHEDTAKVRTVFRKELKAIMDEHYNSPSIIAWVPFNENWGAFDVPQITDWVKKYDPSRLVNGNSGFNNNPGYQKAAGDPLNGDFVDTHIYVGPYGASKPDAKRAASLGEYGGVGLFVRGHMWPVENNAYAYEPTPEALTDRYVLMMNQIEQLMKYKGLSVSVYTQTTDVEHEVNGLLTYDRAVEKMDIKQVGEINKIIIAEGKKLNGQ